MPSPFPGMDPYLEQADSWEDFHQSFITHARDMLTTKVGGNYLVKVEVRLFLHELSAEERRYFGKADVGIGSGTSTPRAADLTATTAPLQLRLPAVEIERHSSLEIRDRRSRRLVTVLELLSPSNKTPGGDRDEYITKRGVVLAGPTHFVEIDLRRGGQRPRPPELPACDYYVLVSRAEERPVLGIWPLSVREPLPAIPIPLTAPDADVWLDLQDLFTLVFDAADYGKYIHAEKPEPPLSDADATWAQELVAQKAQAGG